jgi:hypothetical protein
VYLTIVQLSEISTNYFIFFQFFCRPIKWEPNYAHLDGHLARLVSVFLENFLTYFVAFCMPPGAPLGHDVKPVKGRPGWWHWSRCDQSAGQRSAGPAESFACPDA